MRPARPDAEHERARGFVQPVSRTGMFAPQSLTRNEVRNIRRLLVILAKAQGCPGKFGEPSFRKFVSAISRKTTLTYPLPPPAGGRGQGEGGRRTGSRHGTPHPPADAGPSLSPLRGGEGSCKPDDRNARLSEMVVPQPSPGKILRARIGSSTNAHTTESRHGRTCSDLFRPSTRRKRLSRCPGDAWIRGSSPRMTT
jgi:hypothetical protein